MKPYYRRAGISIYHADAGEVLPELGRFDLLCTDPPYGLGAARRSFGGAGVKRHMTGLLKGKCVPKRNYGDSAWDDKPVDAATLHLAICLSHRQIIFGGNYFDLGKARCWLIWDKLRGNTDYADGELAWTNFDRAVRIIRHKWNGFLTQDRNPLDKRVHPTQKPIAVMKWAIEQARPKAENVLDPWMGSGTTLLAAQHLGLPATGIEISEKYCEIAANRLSEN